MPRVECKNKLVFLQRHYLFAIVPSIFLAGYSSMGSMLISVPDMADGDLVFDEAETKQILIFFWPHKSADINGMTVDNEGRRLAQSALIAAIDGSYAMGFIDALGRTIVRPGSGIKSLAQKLGRKFIKHWWKHATQRNLEAVKIYDSVRVAIASKLKFRIDATLQGVALRRGNAPFYATSTGVALVWA